MSRRNRITVNAGGRLFETTRDTLLLSGAPFFEALLGPTGTALGSLRNNESDELMEDDTTCTGGNAGNDSELVQARGSDAGSEVFLDRDPDLFADVLAFMRSSKLPAKVRRDADRLDDLMTESEFFAYDSLRDACNEAKVEIPTLKEENKRLRDENEELHAERTRALQVASSMAAHGRGQIEITGPKGAPVYARGSIENAVVRREPPGIFREVDLINDDPSLCPMSGMEISEVRLNGLLIGVLKDSDSSDNIGDEGDENGNFFYLFEPSSHGVEAWEDISVDVEFGPLPAGMEEYVDTDNIRDEDIQEVVFKSISLHPREV